MARPQPGQTTDWEPAQRVVQAPVRPVAQGYSRIVPERASYTWWVAAVAGTQVYAHGTHTGAFAGRVLRSDE